MERINARTVDLTELEVATVERRDDLTAGGHDTGTAARIVLGAVHPDRPFVEYISDGILTTTETGLVVCASPRCVCAICHARCANGWSR